MKFKKTVLAILCVVLCLSALGQPAQRTAAMIKRYGGTDRTNGAAMAAKDEQNRDNGLSDNKSSDNGGASADSGQAPVIESGKELKSMVDEFNNTDDPEKKEELRKKLEAFLNQAEQQSAASATENNENK